MTWTARKCVLYQSAWDWAVTALGTAELSDEFLTQNSDFIATGCTEAIPVSPHNPQELELANMLTVMTMSEGMASTFVPFSCPAGTP